MNKKNEESKKIGDFMFTDERAKVVVCGYIQVGRTMLQKVANLLMAEKFEVTKETLEGCLDIVVDANDVSCETLERLITMRLKDVPYNQVEDIRERCSHMMNEIANIVSDFESRHTYKELNQHLFDMISITDAGDVELVHGWQDKCKSIASVNFESQEAIDLAYQHAQVAAEIQKFFGMMNDAAKKQLDLNDFFSLDFAGNVSLEEVNYNVLV